MAGDKTVLLEVAATAKNTHSSRRILEAKEVIATWEGSEIRVDFFHPFDSASVTLFHFETDRIVESETMSMAGNWCYNMEEEPPGMYEIKISVSGGYLQGNFQK